MPPHCFEFVLPDAAATDADTWESVLLNLRASLRAPHLRLLSYVNPVDAEEFEAVRRAQMALQKSDMGRRFIEQEARLLSLSLRQRENSAWSLRHYLLTWGRAPAALAAYLRPNAYPPNPLVAPATLYAERLNYLHPKAPGLPYVCLLASYHFQRDSVWTWHTPWADLLTRADGPMLLAVDVVRVSDERLRLMRRGLEATARVNQDADMARMAARAEDALQQGDEAYEMRVIVLLSDTRLESLHQRAERLRNAHENTLLLSRLAGQQWQGLEFFSAREHPAIGQTAMASAHSLVFGTALPVVFGGLGGVVNRVEPKGTYIGFRYGLNEQPLGPVHWNMFGDATESRAAHIGILGQIGSGKTVSLSALLARFRATEGYPVVFMEPLGNARKLAAVLQASGDRGLRYHAMDWKNLRLNPMDWIAESVDVATGRAEQVAHLVSALTVMLGRPLNNFERGHLDAAVQAVYAEYTPAELEDVSLSPLLADLCAALEARRAAPAGRQAVNLAVEITGLYVTGGLGQHFNTHTALPARFDGADLFDLSAMMGMDAGQAALQQMIYYFIFANFLRVCQAEKRRGLRVRRLFAIDEFFRMARNPYLLAQLENMVKTARNLGVSVVIAEQNATALAQYPALAANIPYWLVFKQEPSEAAKCLEIFARDRFPRDYADLLPRLGPGACVGLLDTTQVLRINLLPVEGAALVPEKYARPAAAPSAAARRPAAPR